MKVALVQSKLTKNMEQNAQITFSALDEVVSSGSDLVCFPELQFSPFFPQYSNLDVAHYAIDIDNQVIKKLQETCSNNNLIAIPNFYLAEDGNFFDASPLINSKGEILGISKMVHIVQAPCFYEQDYYQPSDSGFHVYDAAEAKIGVVICFDRHLPESIRTCALKGAEIIIIPTANTKAEPIEMFEWEMRIAAMQNGVFIVMCNRVGVEDEMEFCGESIVIDPFGNVLTKANDKEQILYADIDLGMVKVAQNERPYIKLRRPEFYK